MESIYGAGFWTVCRDYKSLQTADKCFRMPCAVTRVFLDGRQDDAKSRTATQYMIGYWHHPVVRL